MEAIPRLVDVDWSCGVTTSSSQAHEVLRPFVRLRLTLQHEGSSEKEVKILEMTQEQASKMLAECHKIQASFDKLRE